MVAGIVLLIASNWDDIPRGVKLGTGLGLMLAAHGVGWWLREVRQDYRKTGEALHLAGSLLFLGNIALVGQIYHLVSRPPNAFLLWWAGIVALPWLLKSEIQHLLVLLAFGLWFGMEVNEGSSLIRLHDESQVLAYALLGLVYVGIGYALRRGAFASFAKVTERFGVLALLVFSYPLTWQGFMGGDHQNAPGAYWVLPLLAVVGVALVGAGTKHLELDRQWRWTWALTLAFAACLLVGAFYAPHERTWGWGPAFTPVTAVPALAIFVSAISSPRWVYRSDLFLVDIGDVFLALASSRANIGFSDDGIP